MFFQKREGEDVKPKLQAKECVQRIWWWWRGGGGGLVSVTEFLFLDSVLQSHPISILSWSYPLHLQGNRLPYPWQQATSQVSFEKWGSVSSRQCGHSRKGWHWRGLGKNRREWRWPPNEEFIKDFTGFCHSQWEVTSLIKKLLYSLRHFMLAIMLVILLLCICYVICLYAVRLYVFDKIRGWQHLPDG